MVHVKALLAIIGAMSIGQSLAHPGMSKAEMEQELVERATYLKTARRDLSHCAEKLKARGITQRALERRTNFVKEKRHEIKLKKRELKERSVYGRSYGGYGNRQSGTWSNPESSAGPASECGQTLRTVTVYASQSDGQNSAHAGYSAHSSSQSGSPVASGSALTSSHASSLSVVVGPSGISSSGIFASASTPSGAIPSGLSASGSFASAANPSGLSASGSLASGSFSGAMPMGAMPSSGMGGNSTGGGDADAVQSLSSYGTAVAAKSHQFSNLTGITQNTSDVESTIFGNPSCILNPEGETGPFYVEGELIRSDIAEDQEGVPTYFDGQFINVNTCEPIEDLYWDVWHCNSTGVYAGVIGNGNGNSADTSNLNATFLRGLQPTDSDGVAKFESIFPGHYSGRATHMHIVAHQGGTVLSNGTYSGGNTNHVGQVFFDQDLITDVNALSPYSTNTISITENANDRVFAAETTTEGSDPVMDYVLLGDSVSDGLFLWISMGVDPDATYTADPAAIYGADGGVVA